MNKHLHRIVFNARRSQRMAVAESARSCGKAGSGDGEAPSCGSRLRLSASLRPVVWSALLALGSVWLVPASVAQIVADPSAPRTQQPTILQTANGLPQVNIQAPSAAGVSRNTYSQFDVQRNGAILNNSRVDVQTQMGGWVQANPWLATGGARVILNEVNSSNPSLLNGYVEVAGQRAEVVIANPSGIRVNGGGFVNASNVTLTTGTPVMRNGSLESYRVQGGSVSIEGLGLDMRGADHAAILARAMQVNAGIWAKELKVVTGANEVQAASLGTDAAPQSQRIAGSGSAPAFALDVAAIGGMYAGKIFLIGTEAGLGARNAGLIAASSGTLTLSSDGWLSNTGMMQASGNVQINTQGNTTNTGTLDAGNDVALTSAGLNNTGGAIHSARDTNIQTEVWAGANAGTGYGTVSAGRDLTVSAEGDQHITTPAFVANRNLSFTTTGSMRNDSLMQAGTDLSLNAAHVTNDGSLLAGETLAVTATDAAGAITNRGNLIGGSVHLTAPASIVNTGPNAFIGASDAAGELVLLSNAITNADDVTASDAMASTTIYGAGRVVLAGGVNGGGNYTRASTITNRSALIESGGDMTLAAQTVTNTRRVLTMSDKFDLPVSQADIVALNISLKGETGQINVHDPKSIGGVYIEPPHEDLYNSDYLYTDYKGVAKQNAVQTISPMARIVAGGGLSVNAATLRNYWSQIASTGNMNLTGVTVDQDSWRGAQAPQIKVVYSGDYVYRTYRGWIWTHSFCDNDNGCDAPADNRYYTRTLYDASLTSNGTISGTGVTLQNGVSSVGFTAPGAQTVQMARTTVPNNGQFRPTANANANYLIETNPLFTNRQQWLGSDYLLSILQSDPSTLQKRLGDGFYEQRLIREQVAQLTGRQFLGDYSSTQEEYQALMNNAVTVAKQFNLRPGIALTAEQVANLTSDMVWLVEQQVTLPDGSTTTALAPQVYLSAATRMNMSRDGALVAANNIDLQDLKGFGNGGTVQAKQDLSLQTLGDLSSTGGTLTAGRQMTLNAGGNIDLSSATVQAGALSLSTGKDLNLQTLTQTQTVNNGSRTNLQRQASVNVRGETVITTGGNMNQIGASLNVGGDLTVQTGGDWNLGVVQMNDARVASRLGGSDVTVAGDTQVKTGGSVDLKSARIDGGGALNIEAGKNLTLTNTQVRTAGDVSLTASDELSLKAQQAEGSAARYDTNSVEAGGNLALRSGAGMLVQGGRVTAGANLQLAAQGDLKVESPQSYTYTQSRGGDIRQSVQTERTQIQAQGDVQMYGQQSVQINAVDVRAGGKAQVLSQGDVVLGYNTDTEQHNWTTTSSSSGWGGFKSSTTVTKHETLDKTAEVTRIEGNEVQVLGQNVASLGAQIQGKQGVQVEGADKTLLYEVQEVHQSTSNSNTSSSFAGFTYSKSSSTDVNFKSEALGTQLKSDEAVRVGVGSVTDVRGAILEAPKIEFVRSAGADTSKAGELVLGASTNTTQTSHTEETKTAGVWQKQAGSGETTQTAKQTQLKGQVNIDSGLQVTAQLGLKPGQTVAEQVNVLSQQPGLAYLKELQGNPKVNLQAISLASEKWDYSQQGLTPAGAAILSVAIAAYTGGMGAELAGATSATGAAAMNAGFSSLAAQAGVALANNGGDIGKVLKDMGSSQSVKNTLAALTTAGALTELGNSTSLTGQSGAGSTTASTSGVATAQAVNDFNANLLRNVTNNLAGTVINSAITGKPLNEAASQAALASALTTAGMASAANSIGDARANNALNDYTQAMAHALAGCVGGAAAAGNGGGCAPGAMGAVVGELTAKYATDSGMSGSDALKLAKTMSAAAGLVASGGDGDNAAAINVAATSGANAAANNYLYHYKGKIIARDSKDNDKIINLTEDDLRKLAAENPEVLMQLIAGIGKTDAPILVKDSSAQNMTGSNIQDLNNPNDRAAIAKEADMGYVNINGQARVFVQTGMDNTRQDAGVSAQALSKVLGGVNTGYINNGTEGFAGDVGEYLPNSLSKKDVLNEYTYRTLNAQGPTLIATHSAGNEDARKALQAGALYGHTYDNLSFVSLGSPVSNSIMRQSVSGAGAAYLGQVNDWRDPVTYSKTSAVGVIGGGLVGVGLAGAGLFTLNPILLYTGGSITAGAAGAAGAAGYGIQKIHPFEQYIAKPQSQSIMFDWLKNNPQPK